MAGRPKRRARLARMIGPHKRAIKKGTHKCKKCGRNHTLSEHWSHTHGTHKGARGERAWFGRKARPQGRRKLRKLSTRRRGVVRRGFKRGGTTFGPVISTPTKRYKATWGSMSIAEMRKLGKKARKARLAREAAAHAHPEFAAAVARGNAHVVRGHLAKTPGKRKKHRVAAHLARDPGTARKTKRGKKPRSAAQKAATARMLAGLARSRAKKGGGRKKSGRKAGKTHLVKGHLAKTPGTRKKHRVKGHRAKNPRGGGKARRSPAQKAATQRMLAANRAKRGGSSGYVLGPDGTRYANMGDAYRASSMPADIRGSHRPRLG